ncbi:RBBP9/YdeN family alpha/beta hydrolase [Rhodococcus sp. A5(2022)]|uniref:RBBP9/YdeN family alpha/beta hydrolase n=1 Tax=Rhodococcus sp. A5(2022) TaxID=3003588 RepID=UPI0022A865B7|nr:alpha/beta fold hydrolase [Rhodococcus sp. A5(2022)]MCZ1073390.1 alpha/beta hydrolase [Rhodococcus sp. A5(2022)]
MNPSHSPTVVIVPGLRDHVADHWQTLLAERLSDVRTVPPLERDKLSRAARVAALDDVLREIDGPVVLVAHSAGVMITVHWAQNPTRPIQGALLATPADLELPLPEGYPTTDDLDRGGWNPIPRRRLPFPNIVAASRTDPLGGYRRIAGMAETWGSRLVDLGDVGHLNPAAGYGYWPDAENLLRQLLDSTALPVHS